MKYTFGFVGAGNMGGALCKSAAMNNPDVEIGVCDKHADKAISIADSFVNVTSTGLSSILRNSTYVFIGVKPQALTDFMNEAVEILKNTDNIPVFVSMCAGVSIEKLTALLGNDYPVIRIMPNMPVAVGKGMILYSVNSQVNDEQEKLFVKAMEGAGILDKIEEDKIDAASAVSGCGPAYAFMFIEALADGAVECGIPRDKAYLYGAQMLAGSAHMIINSSEHPAALKDAVCSPGGTTIAGVHALEDGGFRSLVINAVTAAYKRTLEIK